jgi:asparagine synthase (glutamine-hydrolysing)
MLELLNGMYAIVIVDLRISSLYIIRDRFGIKPMYYIYQNNLFAFSSELKSFKYLNGFEFCFRRENLDEYLLFRSVINGTLINGIESLDPGCYIDFNIENKLIKNNYFDINSYSRNIDISKTAEYYKKQLIGEIEKSVKYQLISDVKLGCQLSGGIDSSLITYFSNKIDKSKSFESVSVIFDNPEYSEEVYINHVTNQLGIMSHKFVMDANYYFQNIEKATWHFESPLNHPNTIGIYLLSQKAKEYVTVLLSGEGADEVFGGYTRYNSIKYPYKWKTILRYLAGNFPYGFLSLPYLSPMNRTVFHSMFMPLSIAHSLVNNFDYRRAIKSRKEIYRQLNGSLFDKQIKYEIKTYLPDLLIRQDKMSMAHSIENRVPFLDYNLVKSSFDIPEFYLLDAKSNNGINNEKMLLKNIAADIFGCDFALRNKMGFGFPLKDFFITEKMYQYINDVLLPNIKIRGIINHKVISKWIQNINHISVRELESLWICLSFEIWASLYLDSK